jgi:hypothetical protein
MARKFAGCVTKISNRKEEKAHIGLLQGTSGTLSATPGGTDAKADPCTRSCQ